MNTQKQTVCQITENNYKEQTPFILNRDLLVERGLSDGDGIPNKRYFTLLNHYKGGLEKNLRDTLFLNLIDEKIKSSELHFIPVSSQKMDYYQATSQMGLQFIYLRSNLYIEKLSVSELDELEQLGGNTGIKRFAAETFHKVINPWDNDHTIMFFGPENGNFLVYSGTLVLGIRHDEFSDHLDGEAFLTSFLQKQMSIARLISLVEIYGLKTLNIPVRMIQYNEVSAPCLVKDQDSF